MAAYSAYSDRELTALLKDGDHGAFSALYGLYSERIYGRLLSLLKDQDMADELIQDLFLKVWEKRDGLNPEQSFKSYLYKVAENLVYDHFRKLARDKKLQERFRAITTELYSHTEEDLLNKENRMIIDKAVAMLPPQRKAVFTLCKLEGKSYEETGEILGISASTVSNHLVKATKLVREQILKSGDVGIAMFVLAVIKGL
jgi:RNA polymerase sigma-70 factor (ECF subfamily)